MVLSGQSPDGRLVEIVELDGPPVVRGQPVPPRVQEPAGAPAPAVRRVRRGGDRRPRRSRAGVRARDGRARERDQGRRLDAAGHAGRATVDVVESIPGA